jgi:hypothetical protein
MGKAEERQAKAEPRRGSRSAYTKSAALKRAKEAQAISSRVSRAAATARDDMAALTRTAF